MKKQILFLFLLASLFSGDMLFGMKRKRLHARNAENLEPAKKRRKYHKSSLTFFTGKQIKEKCANEWKNKTELSILCKSEYHNKTSRQYGEMKSYTGSVRLVKKDLLPIIALPLKKLTLVRGYRIATLLGGILSKGRLTTLTVVLPEYLNNTSIKKMFKRQPKNPENSFVSLTLEKCDCLTSEFVDYLPNSITTLSVKDCKRINKDDLVYELKARRLQEELPRLVAVVCDDQIISLVKTRPNKGQTRITRGRRSREEQDLQRAIQASLAEQPERRQQEIMPPPEEDAMWPPVEDASWPPVDDFYWMSVDAFYWMP